MKDDKEKLKMLLKGVLDQAGISSKDSNLVIEHGSARLKPEIEKAMAAAIPRRRATGAKQGSAASNRRIRSISRLSTRRLQGLARKKQWKAILESGWNPQAAREYQERNAIADEARRVLLERARRNTERKGGNWQTCLTCPEFERLGDRAVAGCPRAGRASCLEKRGELPWRQASRKSAKLPNRATSECPR